MTNKTPRENEQKQADIDNEKAGTDLGKINRLVGMFGIATTVLGATATAFSAWNAYSNAYSQRENVALQNQQLRLTLDRLAEQNQIHGAMDLVPDLQPDGLFLRAKYENKSARAVHLWMLGVRIFKANGFVAGTTVKTKPELLLYSDSSIDGCPQAICPPGGKPSDKIYPHARSGGSVSLGLGSVHQETLGPYPISDADLKSGVWIQGFAYTRESDDETCAIVEQPSVPGAFPRICEESRKNQPDCWTSAKCPYERVEIRFQHAKPE